MSAATLVHCRPGDEILAHGIGTYYCGARAARTCRWMDSDHGVAGRRWKNFTPDTFGPRFSPRTLSAAQTVVSVEQQPISVAHDLNKQISTKIVGIANRTSDQHYGRALGVECLRRDRNQRKRMRTGGIPLDDFSKGSGLQSALSSLGADFSTRSGAGSRACGSHEQGGIRAGLQFRARSPCRPPRRGSQQRPRTSAGTGADPPGAVDVSKPE